MCERTGWLGHNRSYHGGCDSAFNGVAHFNDTRILFQDESSMTNSI
jgi:hypothetical protein